MCQHLGLKLSTPETTFRPAGLADVTTAATPRLYTKRACPVSFADCRVRQTEHSGTLQTLTALGFS